MKISFKNNKIAKKFNTDTALVKEYGKNCARIIRRRLDDLQAAKNLEVMRALPGRCHELKGDKKWQISLDLEQPLRLIFEPTDKDVMKKEDGGIDWNSVDAVKIIAIEDTHD